MSETSSAVERSAFVDRVERFLVAEADLLDHGNFDDWLELFDEDATYWWPQADEGASIGHQVSLLFDDRARLAERVLRLKTGHAYAQDPRSRVLHLVTNVRVAGTEEAPEVRSNQLIAEVRRGVQRMHAAEVHHDLRRHGEGWRIVNKTVWLLNRDSPIANLTILL